MGENLKKFIDLYAKASDESLKASEDRLAKFKTARTAALALTDPVGDKYKTLGELVAAMISESGELDSELFTRYTQLTLDNESRNVVKPLFSLKSAPKNYANASEVKEFGGEAYFNSVIQGLTTAILKNKALGAKMSFDSILGKNSSATEEKKFEDFQDAIDDLLDNVKLPNAGVLQSSELYSAIKEHIETKGDPTATQKVSPSPVNVTAEPEPKPTGSPINPPQESVKTPSSSTLNPEKNQVPTSTEKATVLGSAPGVPAETASPATVPEVTVKVEPTAANVTVTPQVPPSPTEKVSGPINELKTEPVPQATTTLNTSTSSTTINPVTSTSSTTINPVTSTSAGNTKLSKNVYEKYLGFPVSEEMIKRMESSTVESTASTSTTNTLNEQTKSESTSSQSESESSINEKSIESTSTTSNTNTSELQLDSKVMKKYLGFTMEDLKKEKSEKSSETEVTKTTASLPVKKESSPVENKSEAMSAETSSSKAESEVSVTPVESENSYNSQTNQAQPAAPSQSIDFDTSNMEARLGRIELLLSSPLEVKIIEQ